MKMAEDALKLLDRLVHIGSILPFYVQRKLYITPVIGAPLRHCLKLIDGDTLLQLADKWLLHKSFARKDEIWFIFAAYLIHSDIEIAEKLKVRDKFPSLATEPEDLFLFVRYSMNITRESGKKGLSKTIRKAIVLWYKSKTATQMLEYLARNRGMHGFTHKDLISICHINLSETNLKEIHQAFFKRPNRLIKIVDNLQEKELDDALKRMKAIAQLKICESPETAVKLIKDHEFCYEHLPVHLYGCTEVWKEVIPRMSLKQVIKVCSLFSEKKMFQNKHFASAFLQPFMKHQSTTPNNCEIHPYIFLVEKAKQTNLNRYSEKIKACYYAKRIKKLGLKPCQAVVEKLNDCFLKSFHNVQGLGLNTFITINLQQNYSTRSVITQRQVNCQEAAITFALAYFKSEKNSVVCTYTDNSKLAEINWKRNMGYKAAEEACKTLINKKNCQRSYFPILEAKKRKQTFDLFITIVPSIARGNPGNKPIKVLEMLSQYKEKKNDKAKMVIINLCRFKPGLKHELKQDDGILELCGVDENTPKLIRAFALGVFK